MSRKLLLRIIVLLVITNIATLLLWNKDKAYIEDDETGMRIYSNKEVATIDGKKITYDNWLSSLQSKYGESHLKSMIDHEIVNQYAEEKDIHIHEKVIDRDVSLLITTQEVMDEDELATHKNKWREDILYQYQLEAILTDDVKVDEGEIQAFYDEYAKQYDFSSTIQLSHIVVENDDVADKVMKELEEGALFSFLAEEYSIDEETRDRGGYLGFFTEEASVLPSIYSEVAANMEVHSFSQPLQVNEGVAIIYLHQHLPEVTFTYDELQPLINNELALKQLGFQHSADSLWKDFDIEWVYGQQ